MLLGAIVGATGVGKTDLAVQLAQDLHAEIISADSRQIYQDMAIGTAQPNTLQLQEVPHHLISILPPTQSYSAVAFRDAVMALLAANPQQNYLIVGGTGMYIKVLQEGISQMPPADSILRQRLAKLVAEYGVERMHRYLHKVDPLAAQRFSIHDPQRVLRALEVWFQSGLPWSHFCFEKLGGIGEFPILWLDCERETLYKRINTRCTRMFSEGWVDEVHSLLAKYPENAPGLQGIGYTDVVQYIKGTLNLQSCLSQIQKSTRNYAKRQLTWFRNQFKTEHWLYKEGISELERKELKKIFTK